MAHTLTVGLQKPFNHNKGALFHSWIACDSTKHMPASVAQLAETQCAPTGTVCRRGGVQSPGRPVDFVFGFQGRMF